MKSKLIIVIAFMLGVLSTVSLSYYYPDSQNPVSTTTYVVAAEDSDDSPFITQIIGMGNDEQPSPYDRVTEDKIHVLKDKIVIEIDDAVWARFTDTNSMDPVIDIGSNAIEIVPKSDCSDIHIGDIISYDSKYSDGTIIHRVIEKGYDSRGLYFILKGDNNPRNDPGKVRCSQVQRIVIAVIY